MEVDFSQVHARLEAVKEAQSRLLSKAAGIAIEDIKERTLSGEDVEGEEFIEYRPRYLRKKEDAGRYRGHVDLYWSGELYNSIASFIDGSGLQIWFSDAYIDIARGNQEHWGRNFFGVNERTVEKVHDGLMEEIQKILNGQHR